MRWIKPRTKTNVVKSLMKIGCGELGMTRESPRREWTSCDCEQIMSDRSYNLCGAYVHTKEAASLRFISTMQASSKIRDETAK